MKKILALMLCLLLCLTAAAETAEFSILGGAVTWSTSADEAMEILGEGTVRTDDYDPAVGSAATLTVEGLEMFGLQTERVALAYFNDELFAVYCYFGDMSEEAQSALIEKVSEVCGKAKYLRDTDLSLVDYILSMAGVSAQKTLCEWDGLPGTSALFVRESGSGEPDSYHIAFENAAVSEKIDKAFGVSEPAR